MATEINEAREDTTSLLDVLVVLADNVKTLIMVPLLAGLLALGITFIIPPTFTGVTRILPPSQQQSSIAAAVTAQLGALANVAGGALGIKNPADQYVALLKSRTVYDAMVEQFKLRELYGQKYAEDARKEFEARSKVTAGLKDGVITIEVDDHDPKRAAEMANALVGHLRNMTNTLAITEAGQRRLFFEAQLKSVKDNLARAEVELRASGVNEGTLKVLPASALETIARLKAQISAQEIRIASLRSYMTETNPELRMAHSQLAALQSELAKAEQASSGKINVEGADYVTKYRNFKYNETLFELMARQYEMARLDEAREGAVIQVLDVATPPERKSKPKRALVAVLTTVAFLILTALGVLARERLRQLAADPQTAPKVARLKSFFRGRSAGLS